MKNSLYKFLLLFGLIIFCNTSCDDGFADLNSNPTKALGIDPGYQFSYAQLRTSGGRYENWRASLIYSSMMIQHMSALCGYWTGDKYTFNGGYASSLFDRAYTEQVREIQDLINTLGDPEIGDETMMGMARIWRVVIFHRLTDMYGDVPYTEAGLGAIEGIDFPKYDSQEFIYGDMLAELEAAVSQIGDGGFGNSDILFGGDADKWIRFGNSLMLRLAMRLSEVDPAGAQAWVGKALSGGIMEDNSHDAFIQHSSGPEGINRNGLGEVLDGPGGGFGDDCPRLSKTMVDGLMSTGDPRLDLWGVPGITGAHNGMPNGLDNETIKTHHPSDTTADHFDRINLTIVSLSSPMMFMTSSEAQLLAAEASVRGWGSGDAATHYENGVRNGMNQWAHYSVGLAVEPNAIDAYLAGNPFDAATAMEQIGWQYWLSTFLNEYEAYANWRRTGMPELTPVNYSGNVTNGQIPVRLSYPASESGREPFEAAKAAQGLSDDFPSMMSVPVWWDK